MFSYVFMKILEMKPTTYDRHMDRASRSHVLEAKRAIVKEVTPGSYVLDVGCGTGDLARMMIERTCIVDGFDMNPAMVMAAGERIKTEHLEGKFSARQRGVEGMDGIATETYDAIVSTLVFSELNDDEKCFALQQAQRILRPEGIIIIADEVVPQTWCRRILHSIIRLPLFAITYVIATNATNPLADLAGEMTRAGFTIEKEVRSHGGHSPWSWAGKRRR
ncbi:MAG: class I SAM-dependent methyltransferase [Deltaproteobacteria bacterium]|nr:class I SAM-dependent methyltransferase [Deltaproteobacteria bacterium]